MSLCLSILQLNQPDHIKKNQFHLNQLQQKWCSHINRIISSTPYWNLFHLFWFQTSVWNFGWSWLWFNPVWLLKFVMPCGHYCNSGNNHGRSRQLLLPSSQQKQPCADSLVYSVFVCGLPKVSLNCIHRCMLITEHSGTTVWTQNKQVHSQQVTVL